MPEALAQPPPILPESNQKWVLHPSRVWVDLKPVPCASPSSAGTLATLARPQIPAKAHSVRAGSSFRPIDPVDTDDCGRSLAQMPAGRGRFGRECWGRGEL